MLEYILDAGPIMALEIICSVFLVAVVIDRIRVFRQLRADDRDLRNRVEDMIQNGAVEDAIALCKAKGGPVAAVLIAGIDKYRQLLARGRSIAEIEINVSKTMEDYIPHAMETLERRMFVLPLLASVSPLLGMLGTVVGMIASFSSLSTAGVDSAGVAGGIAVAFINTAGGLLVAVPSVVAYNLLFKKVEKISLELQAASMGLVNSIALGSVQR
ncbi:MAG TPA: MotA/TolQ/ExbB proton channel family protein [Planctomycetota bacterium]|jgi:biopolymer transport protein ExbB